MLENIRHKFSFPNSRPDFIPFSWKLDGGGRELILDLLDRYNVNVMIEVGVLYGGSAQQWLDYNRSLHVVGIDPWDFDAEQVKYWWKYRAAYGLDNLNTNGMSDGDFLNQLLRPDAAYQATLSNLWDYRDRFVPVRGRSPEMLFDLSYRGLSPQLIYFDSDKELNDLVISHGLWPSAILCGDDWTWSSIDLPGYFPVQQAVSKFADQYGMTVQAKDATWYVLPKDA